MEVQVERDPFLRALQMVHNVVEPRPTMPILANVLIEAEGESLQLTATDLELAARISLPAHVAKPGAITLSARKLVEIVKEQSAAPLTLRVQDNAWVVLRGGASSYRLVGLGPEDFPGVTSVEPPVWVGVDGKVLREMLAQTSFAMSQDESRYALNGVLLVAREGELRLVATDGHRLALTSRPVAEAGALSGIVPRKAVHEIQRIVGAGEAVQIGVGENHFVLRMPNVLLLSRLIEGTFPNYEQVVPRAHPHRMLLPRAMLAAALRRVSVLSDERTRPIKATLGGHTLKLSAYHPEFGEAEESLPVEYAGEEIAIGFNSRYLLDALGAHDTEQVVIELKDSLSPGVMKSVEDDGYVCVIMPMRI
jgi:DNA polymerase III subunit beta